MQLLLPLVIVSRNLLYWFRHIKRIKSLTKFVVLNVVCTFIFLDLTVDVRDAVGDRLHISEEFKKDGVSLLISLPPTNLFLF